MTRFSWKKIHLNRRHIHIVMAIAFGSILDWYDTYSYVYITPLLSQLSCSCGIEHLDLFMAFFNFGMGAIPLLGGIIFGGLTDLKNKKQPLVLSLLITLLAFGMSCLSSYHTWGIWAPLSLILLRLEQYLPQASVHEGADFELYESVKMQNHTLATSLVAFGSWYFGTCIGFCSLLFGNLICFFLTQTC